MPGYIQDFVNSFTTDIARVNRFDVFFLPPRIMMPDFYLKEMFYRCESANLPGRTFGTVDQKFGSNPTQKYPMHASYEDITLSFIVSDDMQERTFFDIWMEFVNPTKTFDFAYKDTYVTNITINQYDQYNNLTYAVTLINAYPISVNQMDLDWSLDTPHKLMVTFAYDYWQLIGIDNLNNNREYTKLINPVENPASQSNLGPLLTVDRTPPITTDNTPNGHGVRSNATGNPVTQVSTTNPVTGVTTTLRQFTNSGNYQSVQASLAPVGTGPDGEPIGAAIYYKTGRRN